MSRSTSGSSGDKAEESADSSKRQAAPKRSSTGSAATRGATSKPSAAASRAADSAKRSGDSAKPAAATTKRESGSAKRDAEATATKRGLLAKRDADIADTKREVESTSTREARRPGFFGAIGLFLRQVVAELKKVVTPTRSELFRFTGVVLVFVIIMMVIVTALDLLFGIGASWVFGTGTEVTWPDFSTLFGGTPAPTAPAPAP